MSSNNYRSGGGGGGGGRRNYQPRTTRVDVTLERERQYVS